MTLSGMNGKPALGVAGDWMSAIGHYEMRVQGKHIWLRPSLRYMGITVPLVPPLMSRS